MSKKSFEEIINTMKEIVNASSQITSKVDSLEVKVDTNHKEVMARLAAIEDHIVQPVQKCGAPKTVNTVQYNGIANQLQPLGKCTYRGKIVNYFGICTKCGHPIIQPSPVAYCIANKLDIVCYTCQKGGTPKYVAEFLPEDKNATHTPTSTSTNDLSVTATCEICGKPRRYKSALDFIEKTKEAARHGFPKVMCSACARAKVEAMKANQNTPPTPTFVEYEEVYKTCKADAELNVYQEHLVNALLNHIEEAKVITCKKNVYGCLKGIARGIQLHQQKAVLKEHIDKIYGVYVTEAEQAATSKEDDKQIEENQHRVYSMDEVVEYFLFGEGLSADEVKKLCIKDVRHALPNAELSFNGNDWNKRKSAVVNIKAPSFNEPADETPTETSLKFNEEDELPIDITPNAVTDDITTKGNIGF